MVTERSLVTRKEERFDGWGCSKCGWVHPSPRMFPGSSSARRHGGGIPISTGVSKTKCHSGNLPSVELIHAHPPGGHYFFAYTVPHRPVALRESATVSRASESLPSLWQIHRDEPRRELINNLEADWMMRGSKVLVICPPPVGTPPVILPRATVPPVPTAWVVVPCVSLMFPEGRGWCGEDVVELRAELQLQALHRRVELLVQRKVGLVIAGCVRDCGWRCRRA